MPNDVQFSLEDGGASSPSASTPKISTPTSESYANFLPRLKQKVDKRSDAWARRHPHILLIFLFVLSMLLLGAVVFLFLVLTYKIPENGERKDSRDEWKWEVGAPPVNEFGPRPFGPPWEKHEQLVKAILQARALTGPSIIPAAEISGIIAPTMPLPVVEDYQEVETKQKEHHPPEQHSQETSKWKKENRQRNNSAERDKRVHHRVR